MAPAPAAPERGRGLNLGNPGPKEYIIVGGAALGLALLYFWWKGRQTATAGAAGTGTAAAPATPTGLSTAALSAWFHDQQSSPERGGSDDDDEKSGRKGHEVKVPGGLVGEKYPVAAAKVRKAGLISERSSPFVGYVWSVSPHEGSKLPRRSVVVLRGKPWTPPTDKKDPTGKVAA